MYRYEMHLHTSPVSKCACAGVEESLRFYKEIGYDGVFITNHFLDGNINIDASKSYEEKINFYFSDYENGLEVGKKLGIKVFCGIEISYRGTDFLIYGLDKEWFLANAGIMKMDKTKELMFMMKNGALVVQAHTYREAPYIDHIRLYPRCVHGVEVINASRNEPENKMAKLYADNYGLIEFAGSDNHSGKGKRKLAGMCSKEPVTSESDFVKRVKERELEVFTLDLD